MPAPPVGPTLAWTSGTSDYNPTFSIAPILEGDVIELQIDNNSDFSSLYDSDSNTVDAIEAVSGELEFAGISTLDYDTTYYARARINGGAWSASVSKTMDPAPVATYRYFRLYVTDNGGHAHTAFAELELAETAAGADTTSTATVTSSGDYGGYPATNVIDDNLSTFGHSATDTFPHWWQLDYGADSGDWVIPVEMRITSRPDNTPYQAPTTFKLQGSTDAAAWDDLFVEAALSPGWDFEGTPQVTRAFAIP